MAYETSANINAIITPEATIGTAAATNVTSARVIRVIGTEGLKIDRNQIQSDEYRGDGNMALGRLGGKLVTGSLNTELTVGGATTHLTEGVLRAAWATTIAVGFATMTTVVVASNYLSAAAGDWVGTQGLRVGDVFTLTTGVAANANLRTPIIAISSLTITVPAGTFTAATATSTGTLTRIRKLVQGTTPTRKAFSIEQNSDDSDVGELFLGNRLIGFDLSLKPGETAKCAWQFMGMDRTILTTATTPYFTGQPAVTTGLAVVADDALILKGGVAVGTFTGFDLQFRIAAQNANVIGSFVSPDIFDNRLTVTGTITGLRQDLTYATSFDAETEFDLCIVLTELTSAPKPCFAIYIGRAKIGALSAPLGGGDGPKVETLGLIIGPKETATGYDATVAVFCQSAAEFA
jgi:hypothetical protein